MDQGDVDDLFKEMTEGLVLEGPETAYADMDTVELIQQFNRVYRTLADHRALMEAKTPEDRNLLAQYHELMEECKKRGLK